jgi:hypothetical protein
LLLVVVELRRLEVLVVVLADTALALRANHQVVELLPRHL